MLWNAHAVFLQTRCGDRDASHRVRAVFFLILFLLECRARARAAPVWRGRYGTGLSLFCGGAAIDLLISYRCFVCIVSCNIYLTHPVHVGMCRSLVLPPSPAPFVGRDASVVCAVFAGCRLNASDVTERLRARCPPPENTAYPVTLRSSSARAASEAYIWYLTVPLHGWSATRLN